VRAKGRRRLPLVARGGNTVYHPTRRHEIPVLHQARLSMREVAWTAEVRLDTVERRLREVRPRRSR
jgi:hypothetical protein